ncbi:MAG: hypothetical protein ACO1NO_09355 [Burkholderiaceae bacterium]
MFGLFAKQKKARTVSAAERAALIEKLVANLGTQYRSLKQYRAVKPA